MWPKGNSAEKSIDCYTQVSGFWPSSAQCVGTLTGRDTAVKKLLQQVWGFYKTYMNKVKTHQHQSWLQITNHKYWDYDFQSSETYFLFYWFDDWQQQHKMTASASWISWLDCILYLDTDFNSHKDKKRPFDRLLLTSSVGPEGSEGFLSSFRHTCSYMRRSYKPVDV